MWALQCAGIAPVQLPAQVTLAEEPLTREKTASMVLAGTVRETVLIWTEVTGLHTLSIHQVETICTITITRSRHG
jgi:hypothetical protein